MNKKVIVVFILVMVTALFVNGCGTAIEESLGTPPLAQEDTREKTAYPAGNMVSHETINNTVVIKGGNSCVKSGVLVVISNIDGEVLTKTTADSYGSFETTTISKGNIPEEKILIQAQDKDKALSYPISYNLNPLLF